MKITTHLLRSKSACIEQVEKFATLFPEGVEVTEALCLAHASEFDWNWAARNLLPDPARAEYNHAIAPARAEYNHAIAPALAEFDRAIAPALAEFDRATASAFGKITERF